MIKEPFPEDAMEEDSVVSNEADGGEEEAEGDGAIADDGNTFQTFLITFFWNILPFAKFTIFFSWCHCR